MPDDDGLEQQPPGRVRLLPLFRDGGVARLPDALLQVETPGPAPAAQLAQPLQELRGRPPLAPG